MSLRPSNARVVTEPSGPELARLLLDAFPELNVVEFEDAIRPMNDAGLRSLRDRFPQIDDVLAADLKQTRHPVAVRRPHGIQLAVQRLGERGQS